MSYYLLKDDKLFYGTIIHNLNDFHIINKINTLFTTPEYMSIIAIVYPHIKCERITDTNINMQPLNLYIKNEIDTRVTLSYSDNNLVSKYKNFNHIVLGKVTNEISNQVENIVYDIFIGDSYVYVDYNSININELIFLINRSILVMTDDINVLSLLSICTPKNICIIGSVTLGHCHKNLYNIDIANTLSVSQFRMKFVANNIVIPCVADDEYPFVSCICPTYNRQLFIPNLLKLYSQQDYPSSRRELIILDDSEHDDIAQLVRNYKCKNIRYVKYREHIPIGKKRNILNQLARGEYIVCMDDDDYYPKTRISHAISKLQNSQYKMGGCSDINIYYTSIKKIYKFGPYGSNHATNGTLAYHRKYILTNIYDDNAVCSEERFFLKNFNTPLVQLDTLSTMLCIAHKTNTFDKMQIIHSGKSVNITLNDIVTDKQIIKFYESFS